MPPDTASTGTDFVGETFAGGINTARATYVPAVPGNWGGKPPATLAEALDRIAAALAALGKTP